MAARTITNRAAGLAMSPLEPPSLASDRNLLYLSTFVGIHSAIRLSGVSAVLQLWLHVVTVQQPEDTSKSHCYGSKFRYGRAEVGQAAPGLCAHLGIELWSRYRSTVPRVRSQPYGSCR